MTRVAVLHPCVRCAEASGAMRPARSRCPRCWRWLCEEHLPGRAAASWPERLPDLLAGRLPDPVADHPDDHGSGHGSGHRSDHRSGHRSGHRSDQASGRRSDGPVASRALMAGDACRSCAVHALGPLVPPVRLTTRMAVVSAVSVLGMLACAVTALALAMAVGLGGELTVLGMLVAEMLGGALAGRHAERRVDAWLEARARTRRARRLPSARLLPGRARRAR